MAESIIRTVTGDINPSELGLTDIHEHPFVFPNRHVTLPEGFIIDDYEKTREEAHSYLNAGGSAIVDAQPFGAGRHPELQLKLAQDTGLIIIASTGCHLRFFYPAHPWWEGLTVEEITGHFISEIEEGMYTYNFNDPWSYRSGIKAGIIKISADENGVRDFYETIYKAAAAAQKSTGAPILTHSHTSETGYEQALFLTDQGVDPERIIISHMDREIDYDVIDRTAALGTGFSFDTIGRYAYHDDKSEIDLFKHLIGKGHLHQILVGLDCTLDRYTAHGGEPGYAFLPGEFTRLMNEEGISPDAVDHITTYNPRKKLTFNCK